MAVETIDRFELRERLGSGAFAVVWRAYDPDFDHDVALKVLAENFSQNSGFRDRFKKEARIGFKVKSNRVIRIHHIGETTRGQPYFVMDLADRGTLANRLAEWAPYPLHKAVEIAQDIALGLADLHKAGHIHRDLKPANVLFQTGPGNEEQLLLGDLGLARALDNPSLTQGSGTPRYVAPEQAAATTQPTAAADLYPLGIILCELLSGTLPVNNTNLSAAGAQGSIDVADHFARSGTHVPGELVEFIDELLEVDPHKRPEAAAAAQRLGAIATASAAKRTLIPGATEPAPSEAITSAEGRKATKFAPRPPTEQQPAPAADIEWPPTVVPDGVPEADAAVEEPRVEIPRGWLAVGLVVLIAGAVATFLLSGLGGGDEQPSSADQSTSIAPSVATTPGAPTELEFSADGELVTLRWEHDSADEVVFHLQDDTGARVATALTETEFVFDAPPAPGACFSVAAEAATEGIARPLSRFVEACR